MRATNGPFPTVAATATATPAYTLEREDVKTYIGRVFDLDERRVTSMMTVIDHAQVHIRHAIFQVDYIVQPRTSGKRASNIRNTRSGSAGRPPKPA